MTAQLRTNKLLHMEDGSPIIAPETTDSLHITSMPAVADRQAPIDNPISLPKRWKGYVALNACAICDARLDFSSDRCYSCGSDIGAPNVREATTFAERSALADRYEQAKRHACERELQDGFTAFEHAVNSSGLVVNCTLWFLKEFASQEKSLYANYHQTVQAGVRKAAIPANDQRRSVVDAILFRSYAPSISFGALSLTNQGVISYGLYSMRLTDVTVSHRTSLLEENSFDFVASHHLDEKSSIPLGYRTDWKNRSQLAASKIEHNLRMNVQDKDFAQLLLSSAGDYITDQFIETHIFGSFDFRAVECVSGPLPKSPLERALWECVKEDAVAAGKRIDEW